MGLKYKIEKGGSARGTCHVHDPALPPFFGLFSVIPVFAIHHDHVGDGGRIVRVALAADEDAADVVLLQLQRLADLLYGLACVVKLQNLLYLPCDLFQCFSAIGLSSLLPEM